MGRQGWGVVLALARGLACGGMAVWEMALRGAERRSGRGDQHAGGYALLVLCASWAGGELCAWAVCAWSCWTRVVPRSCMAILSWAGLGHAGVMLSVAVQLSRVSCSLGLQGEIASA